MSSTNRAGLPQTRTAILRAARVVLERDGYYGASLEKVAHEAGVSRQAVYLHFGSKLKLLTSLIQHVNESLRVGERLQEVANASCGEEAMEQWVKLNADTVPKILNIVVQLDAARRSEREAEAVWRAPADDRHLWCLRITRRLASEDRLETGLTPGTAADLLWAITMPPLFEELVVERGWTKSQYVDHVLLLLRRTLLSK